MNGDPSVHPHLASSNGGSGEPALDPGEAASGSKGQRVFLVVVDESEEMRSALRFACRRAQHTSGRVALLYVIEPVEFQHWIGVGRVMEEEARQEAERKMQTLAAEVFAQTGTMPAVHIREGQSAEQLIALLSEEPSISLLVLATADEGNDPGPLVTYLVKNIGQNKFRIPVTLVPGHLSEDEIDALS